MEKIIINPNKIDQTLVLKAAEALVQGQIVALPTETVYGIACRADKQEAVKRLYEIKQRPLEKPFTLAIDSPAAALSNYFTVLPPFGYRLLERFWPGPLTVVFYSVAPGDKKIGVRVPGHPVALAILQQAGVPVYLPSANISGEKEAVNSDEIEKILGDKLDMIVDSGTVLHGQSSTVVDLTFHPFQVLREGFVSQRDIIESFVRKRLMFVCTGNTCRSPMAQFLLEKYLLASRPYMQGRYEIISSGISAMPGTRISSPAAAVLDNKESIDSTEFLSHRLTRYSILSSDIIVTMEDNHTDYVLKLEPTAEGRVFGLKKFLNGQEKDIPDPMGKSVKAYEDTYDLIKKAVIEFKDWL